VPPPTPVWNGGQSQQPGGQRAPQRQAAQPDFS
jgi:hypothetical protein